MDRRLLWLVAAVIAAGLWSWTQYRGTANLPIANGQVVAYPVDTHEAIASGIAAAQAGAVVRQWLAGRQRYGQTPQIYAAGGGWPEVHQEIERLLADAGGEAPSDDAPSA